MSVGDHCSVKEQNRSADSLERSPCNTESTGSILPNPEIITLLGPRTSLSLTIIVQHQQLGGLQDAWSLDSRDQ